jgi:hypothetical protein
VILLGHDAATSTAVRSMGVRLGWTVHVSRDLNDFWVRVRTEQPWVCVLPLVVGAIPASQVCAEIRHRDGTGQTAIVGFIDVGAPLSYRDPQTAGFDAWVSYADGVEALRAHLRSILPLIALRRRVQTGGSEGRQYTGPLRRRSDRVRRVE